MCSVILPFFSATATIVDATLGSDMTLVEAAIQRFGADVARVDVGVAIETNIPRSVGLAGSSAIIIATLQALAQQSGIDLIPMQIASLAHTIEREDLGIAGGWQDQLIQSHGVSALMDFGELPNLEALTLPQKPPIPLYLAWSTRSSEPSGDAHSALRAQRDKGDPVWAEFAKLAYAAGSALVKGNIHDLKAAIDATFDLRATVMDIAPLQRAMIDIARSLGAPANFAGSGGAIIGVAPKDQLAFRAGISDADLDIVLWEAQ